MFAILINYSYLLEYAVPVLYRKWSFGLYVMNIVPFPHLFQNLRIYAIGEQVIIILHIQNNIQNLNQGDIGNDCHSLKFIKIGSFE